MIYTKLNKLLLIVIILIPIFFNCCKKEKEKWVLTFNDEFSGDSLNRNIWRTGFDWGQSSSGTNQTLLIDSAFNLKDGILHIKLNRDTVTGWVYDSNFNPVQKEYYYTAGMIQSAYSFSQLYGYFEIRSKIPLGSGFWLSFWLMSPNSWPPEIDIFEISGLEPNKMHIANHFLNKNGIPRQINASIYGTDFSNDFHIFAIEWNPKEIIWYLDNKKVYRTETCIPDERMYAIISSGLGGSDFSGSANNSTFLPNYFDIDYIRVYKKAN